MVKKLSDISSEEDEEKTFQTPPGTPPGTPPTLIRVSVFSKNYLVIFKLCYESHYVYMIIINFINIFLAR